MPHFYVRSQGVAASMPVPRNQPTEMACVEFVKTIELGPRDALFDGTRMLFLGSANVRRVCQLVARANDLVITAAYRFSRLPGEDIDLIIVQFCGEVTEWMVKDVVKTSKLRLHGFRYRQVPAQAFWALKNAGRSIVDYTGLYLKPT